MDFSISFDVYAISNHNDWVNLHPIKIITFIFPFHRYGNLVPSTKWGKIVTMLYAVCGIPVYFIYFMNMGKVRKYEEITFELILLLLLKVLANIFKWLYRKVYYCAVYRKRLSQYEVMENDLEELNSMKREEEVLIPSTACIWVMLFYITLGTIMFAEWEQWDYLDSCYFCVTSLLKVYLFCLDVVLNLLKLNILHSMPQLPDI